MVFITKDIQARRSVDLSVFDPMVLRDQMAVESVWSSFEHKLFDPGVDKERVLNDILEYPRLFEFIFSSISSASAEYLQAFIVQSFPASASGFVASIAARLLSQISLFMTSLDLIPDAATSFRTVQLAAPVLSVISASFPGCDESPISPVSPVSPVSLSRKGTSQREKKKEAREKRRSIADSKPFKDLGLDVPESKEEAESLVNEILLGQRRILEHYLDVLRRPALAESIRLAYIPTIISQPEPTIASNDTVVPNATEELTAATIESTPSVYPRVQPLRAALHFDTPEGFGDWRILIPSNANRDLRDARKKNAVLFEIIVKKIKELSNGQFSPDNHKRLNRGTTNIPVYEAKMTRDSRLVYQIDCERDFETGVDRQVIRIFGIYTHTQLNRFDWEVLGARLAKRGNEYRERCKVRDQPHRSGIHAIFPASFPPQAEASPQELKLQIPGCRTSDKEEASIMLEKFVAFSQAFLNGVLAGEEGAYVFQMSPTEQEIVKHVGSSYVLGRSGTGKTTTMIFKILGIERAWQDTRDALAGSVSKPRQIFVTQSRMLAEKVEEYYEKVSVSQGVGRAVGRRTRIHVNVDEEGNWRQDLPSKFSELQDPHFPLFLTFDHLCKMLENDFDLRVCYSGEGPLINHLSERQASFVSYRKFKSSYWPHFPQTLTKVLEPSLVFAEFMGIIKGSEKSLLSPTGYLCREDYLALSRRTAGMFATQREQLYDLFEGFLRLKRKREEYDAADRSRALLQALNEHGIPGKKVDFLYVDEAQDNLLIDALVARSICGNADGLFWAGDTAQTISAGSAFRFKDLKAFLYRIEKAGRADSPKNFRKAVQPKAFQLAINYRSHGGIVSFAQTVVHIITQFWPHSIDILAEERGVGDGVKPIMFSGWDEQSIRFEQFLFGTSDNIVEFGATQCILVRDEAARDELRSRVGNIGMILTLPESKGLEFNDVLLYNFFQDSDLALSQWRIVLHILQQDDFGQPSQLIDTRHNVVCRELKFLYVAITRARQNVWIADCSDKGNPMRDVWLSREQVQICTPADEVPKLAVSSAQEEWAEAGHMLFKNGTYRQAVHCYERAGLYRERDVAIAYDLRQSALSLPVTSDSRDGALVEAAEAFVSCSAASSQPEEVKEYYRLAAGCFAEANVHQRAAEAYRSAEDYTESAKAYRKAEMFDDAVQIVHEYDADVDPTAAESIIAVAKLHYFREHQVQRAGRLFASQDEAIEYTEDFGFNMAKVELLENMGQVLDAAELHAAEGRFVQAINLMLRRPEDPIHGKQAVQYLLAGLWRFFSFATTSQCDTTEEQARSILELADQVLQSCSPSGHERLQIVIFQAIARRDVDSLRRLAFQIHQEFNDTFTTLLCLDHVFNEPLAIPRSASCHEISSVLEAFLVYVRHLEKVAYLPDPCNVIGMQRLFAFQKPDEDLVIVAAGTFLHPIARQNAISVLGTSVGDDITMRACDFSVMLQHTIRDRLRERVYHENGQCRSSANLFPCSLFALFGECKLLSCQKGHIASVMANQSFNIRVRICCQQILIYQTLHSLEGRSRQLAARRFWLDALYGNLYPIHPMLGSISIVDWTTIPEAPRAIQVANDWVQDRLYSLRPDIQYTAQYFLTTFLETSTLAFSLNHVNAQRYLGRIPCVRTRMPRSELLRDGQRYIVHDLLQALDGSGRLPISAGILFIQQICASRHHLDLSALCTFIEFIVGSFVIAHRIRMNATLHNTILPRAWLTTLPTDPSVASRDTSRHWALALLRSVQDLLGDIYSEGSFEHLMSNKHAWYMKSSWQAINVMVLRIFRALCLFGCNIPFFRSHVLQMICSVYNPDRFIPLLHIRYVTAKGWDDLWSALRKTNTQFSSPFDELILLKDITKGPAHSLSGIRTIAYTNLHDALMNLRGGSHGPFHLPGNVSAPPVANEQDNVLTSDSQGRNISVDTIAMTEPLDRDEPQDDPKPSVHFLPMKENIDAAKIVQRAVRRFLRRRLDEEIRAACLIQYTYRRYRASRQTRLSGIAEARKRWFESCLMTCGDLRKPYRYYVLGPLPHALVCLEKVNGYASDEKAKAKRRLTDRYSQLEKVNEELDRSSRMYKQVTQLQQLLAPASDFHRAQDIGKLREQVQRIEVLVKSLPKDAVKEWKLDFRLAIRGIVQKAAPSKQKNVKKAKPVLNTEDLDELYF